jgi:hypothetical protein
VTTDVLAPTRRLYERRARLAARTARRAVGYWRQLDGRDIASSWAREVGPLVLALLVDAQERAATDSAATTARLLAAQRLDDGALAVRPSGFADVASDGRPLPTLLSWPTVTARRDIGRGMPQQRALRASQDQLRRMVATQVQDAGRVAQGAATAAAPQVGGYYRYLTAPSCSRCVVLAGRWYRWSSGFARHPRCDCVHVPAPDHSLDGDPRLVEPRGYFDSLTEAEQDAAFTAAGARAIRDGADVAQVVNARRGAAGMSTASRLTAAEQRALRGGPGRALPTRTNPFGRALATTTAGRRPAGGGPRLMPEAIYALAVDREDATRLLRRNGFIA